MLLNSEVLQVLRERGALATDPFATTAPVEKQAGEYLASVCGTGAHDSAAHAGLKRALGGLQLASAEVFQVLNAKPRSAVEVFLLVDGMEARFGAGADALAERVLALVREHFPEQAASG